MGGMWLPTFAGFARATSIAGTASPNNVGANWTATAYTVPDGRGAIITHAWIQWGSGTAPTFNFLNHLDAALATRGRPIRQQIPVIGVNDFLEGWLWMAEGDILQFANAGGDDTTDMDWNFAGLEFDWVDVT